MDKYNLSTLQYIINRRISIGYPYHHDRDEIPREREEDLDWEQGIPDLPMLNIHPNSDAPKRPNYDAEMNMDYSERNSEEVIGLDYEEALEEALKESQELYNL